MAEDPPRRRADPRMRAERFTDAELDEMAKITPEDLLRAQGAWRQDADPRFRGLLDATPDDEGPPDAA